MRGRYEKPKQKRFGKNTQDTAGYSRPNPDYPRGGYPDNQYSYENGYDSGYQGGYNNYPPQGGYPGYPGNQQPPRKEKGCFGWGLLGFLIYNHYPAKVFMGDTGSLFLGGAVAALAFAYDMPLILIFVGIVYICETMSDILQVGYFKLTHGKRIFKMAPLHHHFEMCGWNEKKIVAVFSTVSAVFCVLAFLGVMNRFAA